MGAIRSGRPSTAADTGDGGTLPSRRVRTATESHGYRLEIYGSGGWGFVSLQACNTSAPVAMTLINVSPSKAPQPGEML